ncbi:MAG TPA: NUDIX domain-containing protein [Patescibacteria group bacterium]|nr:NUDIX domain-containing protein [Patescibacteria group bacterium]
MKEEYLDIVDENNKPIGEKKPRSEVHSSGLWHRTVHIYYFMIKDNDYYFLCHLRFKDKDLCPNMWDTRFGGHLQAGESVEEALVEEFKEEIGLNTDFSDFIKGPVRKRNKYPNNEFTYTFYYQVDEDISKLRFEDGEIQKVEWVSAKNILSNLNNNKKEWANSFESFDMIYNYLKDCSK